MLGWLVAVGCVILVAWIWPRTKYPGSKKKPSSDALLTGLLTGIPQEKAGETPASDRGHEKSASAVALICKPSALANYLLKHCRTFNNYSPCVGWSWRASAILQSVYDTCWPYSSPVQFVRDHLQLSDEGLVSLDWALALCGTSSHKLRRTSSTSNSPVLLIVPNSFGKITRNVLKLCEAALSHGYLPVVFNRRSHNGTPLTTLKLQQFGDPADLREAVRYIRYRQPAGRLYAAGESTGAGLLLSYLGECGSSSYVTAAVCLSPVFRCQSWFESGLPRAVQWALVLYQKMSLSRYRTVLGETVHADSLFSSSSLRGLEEGLFCQTPHKSTSLPTSTTATTATTATSGSTGPNTSGSWEAYWDRNEPLRDVDEVAIPVLSVCARDDPVRGPPRYTLPLELFQTNPHFFLLLTEHGGHCGFSAQAPVTGVAPGSGSGSGGGVGMPRTSWSHGALLEFFRATTDFFATEERAKQLMARRRGLGGGMAGRSFRNRSISTCKRVPECSHNIHAIYSWQRSYTR
ncbi:protein ABHD15-like [Gadus chalcogrammus]|uniref:protein ABHD15-like n=1 Tax=Gadus chalcogrammus TaxID=1042646 RepID=UPI0024C4989D|nr:protein ABHD15-like [Gadus chalcogrammus]